ncbi:hypothetical protein G9A89_014201 [Geosiphon pyriformis]|nr:hypothetical protein G9A89_014201 [Geosiphon pyriformis]
MTRAKSKKAAPDICPEISNKISTRGALSVVEATRQNVLKAFPLPSNRNKLSLVATEATSLSLTGFSPVKVPLKRHTWVSPSVAFILTKSPKVFNNRSVNKLVFLSIASTSGAASIISLKKIVKKTKSSEKWRQLLASAIITPNSFVVLNEILDEISVASSSMLSKMGQDQLLAVLPNMMSSGRLSLVLEAKQSFSVGLSVLGNWADQMKTESSPPLETITSHQRFAGWMASTLVSGATFKIKLAYFKTVFQLVHGFLGAKSVSKDNVKLFCVEFASQVSLEAVFLVELTSFVHLATLKIARSLVISKFGSLSAAVVLYNVLLGVSAANIKTAFNVFGGVACVVLKPAGLNFVVSALNHWSVLVDKDSIRIFPLSPDSGCYLCFTLVTFGSQADMDFVVAKTGYLAIDCEVASSPFSKTSKVFKPCFVGFLSYVKASDPPVMSEFPFLVAFASPVAIVNPAVGSRLDSLEKQISDLAALVKSIVEPVGSLVALVSHLLDNNAVKAVQDIACFRFEVDFGGMDYNDMQAAKSSLLSENTVKSSGKSTRLFFSEFIFDSRNLNSVIKKIHELELFSPLIVSA